MPPIRLEIIDDLETFHPVLMQWWNAHDWPGIPAAILPKFGIRAVELLEDNGTRPIAATFLYMDNSTGVSMLEWTVSNPDASPRQVAKGIAAMVEFAKLEAKKFGYCIMLSSCIQPALIRLLERNGFTVTDQSVTHLCTLL